MEKHIWAKLLIPGYLLICCLPLLLLDWLEEQRDHEAKSHVPASVTLLWALSSLLSSWWLGSTTARYMLDEERTFLDALKHTWYDARLRLTFLPLIGLWFTPDEDKTCSDDDNKNTDPES